MHIFCFHLKMIFLVTLLTDGPSHTREEWDDMMKRLEDQAQKVTGKFQKACCEEEVLD